MKRIRDKWEQVSALICRKSGLSTQQLKGSWTVFDNFLEESAKRDEQLVEKILNITELNISKKDKNDSEG